MTATSSLNGVAPFVDDAPSFARPNFAAEPTRVPRIGAPFAIERDFLETFDPAAETSNLLAEVFSELEDPEFELAVHELVNDTAAFASEQYENELGDGSFHVEKLVSQHLAPIARLAEEALDRVAEAAQPLQGDGVTELEIDELFARVSPPRTTQRPAFDQFLGSVWKKAKSVAKAALKVAKKGVVALAGPVVKAALAKLKALVQPILKRVLATALGKIPANYRPMAEALAKKLGLLKVPRAVAAKARKAAAVLTSAVNTASVDTWPVAAAEPTAADSPVDVDAATDDAPPMAAEPAAADVGDIQEELDEQLVASLAGSTYSPWGDDTTRDGSGDLDRARDRLVRELAALNEGDDPAPVIENFLPVVLTAARLGVKLLGRPRVVRFLGSLIGTFIRPLIGNAVSVPLGQAIADLGLRALLQTETPTNDLPAVAHEAIARTVEETARGLSVLPESVFENDALLEAHALEVFEHAAAANLPQSALKPAHRESQDANVVWVPLPRRGRRNYKKFSKVFDVSLSPSIAKSITTFGGTSLAAYMRDQLHLPAERTVRARVVLFELLPGARLGHIAHGERLRGVGGAGVQAWRKLHPLTPDAAALLLREPRLGRRVPGALDPLRPRAGQRVYLLEVEGAPSHVVSEPTHAHVEIDHARDEVRWCLFLAEPIAQRIAVAVRKNGRDPSVLSQLRAALNGGVRAIFAPGAPRLLRVIGVPGSKAASRAIAARSLEWVWRRLPEWFERSAPEFVAATEADALGVSLRVCFPGVVRRFAVAAAEAPRLPSATLQITPGHRH